MKLKLEMHTLMYLHTYIHKKFTEQDDKHNLKTYM